MTAPTYRASSRPLPADYRRSNPRSAQRPSDKHDSPHVGDSRYHGALPQYVVDAIYLAYAAGEQPRCECGAVATAVGIMPILSPHGWVRTGGVLLCAACAVEAAATDASMLIGPLPIAIRRHGQACPLDRQEGASVA